MFGDPNFANDNGLSVMKAEQAVNLNSVGSHHALMCPKF